MVGRVGPEPGRHRLEVVLKLHGGLPQGLERFFRAELGARPVELGVSVVEELLGKLEHEGLVFLGHAKNRHDHAQRVEEGHVGGEIALAVEAHHTVDELARDLPDRLLHRAQRARHDMREHDGAQVPVLLAVDRDQAADQVGIPARDHPNPGLALPVGDEGRLLAVAEDVGLTLDLLDVGMAADHPEGIKSLEFGDIERRLGPDLPEGLVGDLTPGIAPGVYDRLGQIRGQSHFPLLRIFRLGRPCATVTLGIGWYTVNKYLP